MQLKITTLKLDFTSVLIGLLILVLIFSCSENSTQSEEKNTVKDIDGNKYQTVIIGNQVWMAENLKVTRYPNGDLIPNVTDNLEWISLNTGAYASYNNDNNNVPTYGLLYNWYAAADVRGLAPEGWHIPSDQEWQELVIYLGGDAVAGGKMKEAGTAHWRSPNDGATNESGFSALPGGFREGYLGAFSSLGRAATWWALTAVSTRHAFDRRLTYNYSDVTRYYYFKQDGFSIRCVRD